MAKGKTKSRCGTCENASRRAKQIVEIKPGAVTVYTAYLVVLVRLVVVLAHTIIPGLQ